MASLIVILLVIPLVLRGYARRVEAGGGGVAEKVHRIRRAQMAAILALPVLEVIMLAEVFGEARLLAPHHGAHLSARPNEAAVALGTLVYFAIFAGGAMLAYLATYPATARIRGLRGQPGRAGRRQARMLFAVLVPQLIWFAVWIAVQSMHGPAQIAVVPVWIAFIVGMIVFAPVLMRAVLPTRPLDSSVRGRLMRLTNEHQVRVKDIQCMDTGPEQTANAMLMGLLPQIRYVLITDRLVRDLEPDELDAVLTHELAHAKKHHLLIKLGALMATWLAMAGVVIAAVVLSGHRSAALITAVILLVILMPASLLVIQGVVGVRLERSADDYASATADPDALRRGLEKLTAANATKRRTGRMWNLLTQHPGIDQRIERLSKSHAHTLA